MKSLCDGINTPWLNCGVCHDGARNLNPELVPVSESDSEIKYRCSVCQTPHDVNRKPIFPSTAYEKRQKVIDSFYKKTKICPVCFGVGHRIGEKTVCPKCNGAGKVTS
jgi:RecJ-like exonuclease